uniref:Uncharacterized protein n=1 Tax=Pyxicephalus adspersus TaxID=30357 RepID=A0AAV3ATZ2_PYXAD|nr:TPA: hypothetical protein GDO54_007221 [Pyxicephalus adspersus]
MYNYSSQSSLQQTCRPNVLNWKNSTSEVRPPLISKLKIKKHWDSVHGFLFSTVFMHSYLRFLNPKYICQYKTYIWHSYKPK